MIRAKHIRTGKVVEFSPEKWAKIQGTPSIANAYAVIPSKKVVEPVEIKEPVTAKKILSNDSVGTDGGPEQPHRNRLTGVGQNDDDGGRQNPKGKRGDSRQFESDFQ